MASATQKKKKNIGPESEQLYMKAMLLAFLSIISKRCFLGFGGYFFPDHKELMFFLGQVF